jgi:hypothetical protein
MGLTGCGWSTKSSKLLVTVMLSPILMIKSHYQASTEWIPPRELTSMTSKDSLIVTAASEESIVIGE